MIDLGSPKGTFCMADIFHFFQELWICYFRKSRSSRKDNKKWGKIDFQLLIFCAILVGNAYFQGQKVKHWSRHSKTGRWTVNCQYKMHENHSFRVLAFCSILFWFAATVSTTRYVCLLMFDISGWCCSFDFFRIKWLFCSDALINSFIVADVPTTLFFTGGAIPCGFQGGMPMFPIPGQDYSLLAQVTPFKSVKILVGLNYVLFFL